MKQEDLHAQVDILFPRVKQGLTRALVHALIDLGQVTDLRCTWAQCVMPNVTLAPSGTRRASVTLDHTIARNDGGLDHWTNIRLMHHTCNMRKGASFTPERRQRISESVQQRWRDPEYRDATVAKVTQALSRDDVRARKSEAMKRHWADKDKRAEHTAKLARGDKWKAARSC